MKYKLNYKKLDYKHLTDRLIFVDFFVLKCDDNALKIEEDVMIKCFSDIPELTKEISSIENCTNVFFVMFIFQTIDYTADFDINWATLFIECREKFPHANIVALFNDKINSLPLTSLMPVVTSVLSTFYPSVFSFIKQFENGQELKDHIDNELMKNHLQFYRCPNVQQVTKILMKRCKPQFNFQAKNETDFSITYGTVKLYFILTENYYNVCIHSSSEKPLLKLKNEHLLGLYDIGLLFDIVDSLESLKVALIDDELLEYTAHSTENPNPNYSSMFTFIISVFYQFSKIPDAKKLKIQLGNNGILVFNRHLKVSLALLETLLKSGAHEQVVSNLSNLSILYFKCFSKKPVCCRMQSLAPKAIVYDFEVFTYHHIDKNRALYITICKILFPYVADVDDEMLQQKYLEVMPVALIQRFHGVTLEHFVMMLSKIRELNVSFIALEDGTFKVGNNIITPNCFRSLNFEYYDLYELENSENFSDFFEEVFQETRKSDMSISDSCNSDNFLKSKRRFIIEKEIESKEFQKLIDAFLSFEKSEGIYLAFINKRIGMIDEISVLESDSAEYKSTADYCYYNENELKKFFKIVKDSDSENILKKIPFKITSCGLIEFEELITISPTTFLKINNTQNLLKIIIDLCRLYDQNFYKCLPIPEIETQNEKIKGNLVEIAKYLNPLIRNLTAEDFQLKNFCCLPNLLLISHESETFYKILKNLRNNNIKVLMDSKEENTILTDRIDFHINDLEYASAVPDFVMLSKRIEEINEDFEDFVYILKNIVYMLNYSHDQLIYYEPHILTQKDMNDCVLLFTQNNVQHVAIVEKELFIINRALIIRSKNLLQLSPANFNIFLEVTNLCCKSNVFKTWITLADEFRNSKVLQHGKKFGSFAVTADNINIYLELVKLLTPCLEHIPDEDILSYEWLEVLPSHLLINQSSLEELLKIIKGIKLNGHEIYFTLLGLSNKFVDLPSKLLLQVKDIKKICEFLNYFTTTFNPLQLTTNQALYIHLGGEFIRDSNTQMLPDAPKIVRIFKSFSNQMIETGKFYSLKFDMEGNVMLGNYLWSNINLVDSMKNEFFKMVDLFEDAIQTDDLDLMRSINGLKNKKKAITLVKVMNEALSEFSDEDLCSKNLQILPTFLWEACNKDDKTYEKAIIIFEALKKEKLLWCLKLNGNIYLGHGIIITPADLLSIYHGPEKLEENINNLKILKDFVGRHQYLYLVCVDEFRHSELKNPKVANTGNLSYAETIALKTKLMKEKNIEKIRIEPMGAFFMNDHLWMKARTALQCDVAELSKIVKQVFPNTIFQCENPKERLYISSISSSDEQLYRYCLNVCELIKEKYTDIKFRYLVERNMFELNGILAIHPRSFFHLQDMETVVKILKNFDQLRKKNLNFLKSNNAISKEERQFCKELWAIKSKERVEFDVVREACFTEMGKIVFKNKVNLSEIGNIAEVITDNEKEYFGIENVVIHGYPIFDGGITNAIVNSKDGVLAFEYPENIILESLKFVNEMEPLKDTYKCKNLFDFQSIIEILQSYPSFTKKKNLQGIGFPENFNELSRNEKILWWLQKVQEQQNNNSWKFKFSNAIKGLHHWFNHEKGFINLKDYYTKMNDFFKTTNYSMELDTQNGDFLNRRYENEIYMGSFMVAHDNSGRDDCVATFQKKETKLTAITFLDEKSLSSASKIIFTDKSFKNFVCENPVSLQNDTVVVHIQNMNLTSLNNYVSRAVKFSMKKVLILFFTELKPKPMKKKNEQQKAAALDVPGPSGVSSATKKLFSDKNSPVMLCYSLTTPTSIIEILHASATKMFKTAPMDENFIANNNAAKLKAFIENCFQNFEFPNEYYLKNQLL